MKHLLALGLTLAACGGGGDVKKVCENFSKQCGAELSATDLADCAAEIPKIKSEVGDEAYDSFVACGAGAESCGEVLGCAAGLAAKGGMLKNFEKGFNKVK